MKHQLRIDYEGGKEVYDLTKEELDKIYINVVFPQLVILDVNAILRIAKKRRFFPKEKTGDIKE